VDRAPAVHFMRELPDPNMTPEMVAIRERFFGWKEQGFTSAWAALDAMFMERCSAAEAERDALKAENERLKAPLSDEEYARGQKLVAHMNTREAIDALYAARASAPKGDEHGTE
jgi:hypothetical protein